ncbi:hypothetical protein G7043_31340 [Lentzea sp. NEAU-D13]|uniref:Uncharacterized protein n=1 Tax=Lentzea alba TaxID=2714351 RepID=A0A7C9RV18_9PSEU|nr:hypothetical protein [Lentzea alba]NGY63427.1 hypothetical protein [Lentzea alba]
MSDARSQAPTCRPTVVVRSEAKRIGTERRILVRETSAEARRCAVTTNQSEFTSREKDAYVPAPCENGHEGRKHVEWTPLPTESHFGDTPRRWAIGLETCWECNKPRAEPGEEWRDELE